MTEPNKPEMELPAWLEAINRVPLILQIIIGLILGIILAVVYPYDQTILPAFGNLFVKALKAIAPVLVLVLIAATIARQKLGVNTNIKAILVLYILTMVLASTLALCMTYLFPTTFPILGDEARDLKPPQGIKEVLINFVVQAVDNPVNALIEGNYIALLVWGVAFGLTLRLTSDTTKKILGDLSDSVAGVVRIVIRFAPLGVMGLVYSSATEEGGLANLWSYVHVINVLVVTMLLVAFGTNAIIFFLVTGKNPYPSIITCITQSGVTAFFTRSSAANLPINLALCKRLKLPKETYSLSIPLGCTINMAGASVTIVVMTMAAVNTLGIQVDFASALIMCISAVLCACGASGIAGGSLLLIPLACSIFGIDDGTAMQVVGIGFIIAVLQDSTETALNSSTDVLITIAACERARRIERREKDARA